MAQFDTESTALPEFERALRLDDSVLRYLIVVNEGLAPERAEEENDE